MIPGLSPHDIGLPPKFSSWRPGQLLALDRGLSSTKRFILHSMPVGEGKSALYVGHALLSSKRTCILTSTKGLQKQLLDDFDSIGLVEIKGRANYPCDHKDATNCEEGQYYKCQCHSYEEHRNIALESSLVVTNYTYFILSYLYGRGLGQFDLLICDEAHDVPDEVCSAMAIEITYGEATKIGIRLPREYENMEEWHKWAEEVGALCVIRIEELRATAETEKADRGRVHHQTARDQQFWSRIARKCVAVLATKNVQTPWITERTHEGYKLEPVWAMEYSHLVLFRDTPKVLLTSATMVRKTKELIGISNEDSDFYEYPSSFSPKRSPVYLWGPCRIDNKTNPAMLDVWQARIDNIIRHRLDRKGIIHSVSYDRAKSIQAHSEFGFSMIVPKNGKETQQAIYDFQDAEPPSLLVSPSITTGYDFPFSDCEYNIICKVPFLDTRAPIIAARQKEDPEYSLYITAQTLVQAHGRSMRDPEDQSETFITDMHINWFIRKHKNLFPSWFLSLLVRPQGMPEPPAPLNRQVVNRPPRVPQLSPGALSQSPISNVIEFPAQL